MNKEREKVTRIGIVAELGQETRVAATPVTVRQLAELGYDVVGNRRPGESTAHARTAAKCPVTPATVHILPFNSLEGLW